MITDELLFRYLNGETSPRESRRIESWLREDPSRQLRLDKLSGFFSTAANTADDTLLTGWTAIAARMTQNEVRTPRKISLPARIARIAAVLLVLAGSAILWISFPANHTLTNKGSITRSVSLPDGTQVDLGPGSKLIYTNDFLAGERTVRLSGDAYFDVTSDPEHPFTVVAGEARIKVTGTCFAVTAPAGKNEIEVTVRSGKVLFYNSETLEKNSFRMGLLAGEKGIFDPISNRMDKTRDPYFQTTP